MSGPITTLQHIKTNDLKRSGVVYFVQDNAEYQLTLATLLSILQASDVGLSKVDNTADAEKPVSQLQQQALDAKAEKNHGHAISNIEGLADALSKFVPLETLNELLGALELKVASRVTNEAFEQYKTQIEEVFSQIAETDQSLSRRITQLENSGMGDYVTTSTFQNTLEQLQAAFTQAITGVADGLKGKADKQHNHMAEEIVNLTEVIQTLIGQEIPFIQGEHEW